MSEVLNTQAAKVFEVMYGESMRFSGKRIVAVSNSLGNNIRGEVGYRIIKRTILEETSLNNPGRRVAGIGDSKGELLSKGSCYFFVAG